MNPATYGYSIGAEKWSSKIHVPQTIEGAFAQGANEMIVVLPDSDVLDKYGIVNSFELYSGTHTSKVADRFQNHVMPFLNRNLVSRMALAGRSELLY